MSEISPVKVTSLHDLPREIAPARDLWPQIEAQLSASEKPRRRGQNAWVSGRTWAPLGGLAAALAVGIWIGHGLLPLRGRGAESALPGAAVAATNFVTDPRYVRVHSELMRTLNQRLATLPPATRVKVLASLDTIHRSMQDIQTALGRDPGNALLQELLVDTYQDEMRVLTDVQDATPASGET
jgi:hypothetical protein